MGQRFFHNLRKPWTLEYYIPWFLATAWFRVYMVSGWASRKETCLVDILLLFKLHGYWFAEPVFLWTAYIGVTEGLLGGSFSALLDRLACRLKLSVHFFNTMVHQYHLGICWIILTEGTSEHSLHILGARCLICPIQATYYSWVPWLLFALLPLLFHPLFVASHYVCYHWT